VAQIDIDKLLSEISPDDACGPDLEYDADFIALMQDAEGKPPKYTPDGQLVEEGEEPDWRDIRQRCVAMFGRTIDLRVAMVLTNALLCESGLPGLRDGLALILAMLERHWDAFHPRLDPDDDNDPLMRMNLIAGLAAPIGADGDPRRFQQRLREVPLAESRQLGRFGLKDLMIATGDLPPSGDHAVNEGLLEAAFRDTDGDRLKEWGKAADECVGLSKSIDQWLTNKVGASKACDLDPWHAIVTDLRKRLAPRVEALFPGETGGGGGGETESAPSAGGAPAAAQSGQAQPLSGSIGSREDVVRALNKVLEYYTRHEPSSPVPMLIRRAQRLVTMGFVDIIRDLSPSALDQIRAIGGDDALNAAASAPPSPGEPASRPAASSGGDAPIRLGADFNRR
jgi:type VI secretion system protein ImpA